MKPDKPKQVENKPAQTQKVETKNVLPVGEAAEKAYVTDILKTATKSADFRDATITKIYDADRYNLVVFLNGHDNITTNLIYSGYKAAVKDIVKALYSSPIGNKINDVKVSIYSPMVNTQTGAKSEAVIYMLAMTRARADEMHWDNFAVVDIEQAATERFIHPALLRKLNSK